MTVGNLIALRQTNIVRMLAYSAIAQAGYMLAPLAVAGESSTGRVAQRGRHLPPHLRRDEPRRVRASSSPSPARPARQSSTRSAACSSTRPG